MMSVLALLLPDEGIFALMRIQSPFDEVIFAMINTRSLSPDKVIFALACAGSVSRVGQVTRPALHRAPLSPAQLQQPVTFRVIFRVVPPPTPTFRMISHVMPPAQLPPRGSLICAPCGG